jgi:translation initiation factor IF-2
MRELSDDLLYGLINLFRRLFRIPLSQQATRHRQYMNGDWEAILAETEQRAIAGAQRVADRKARILKQAQQQAEIDIAANRVNRHRDLVITQDNFDAEALLQKLRQMQKDYADKSKVDKEQHSSASPSKNAVVPFPLQH